MNRFLTGLSILSCILLLCTSFATASSLANGIVMGKVFWFHLSMIGLAGTVFVSIIAHPSNRLSFDTSDAFVLILFGIVLTTYAWGLNPEPEKLLFGGQLVCLWFMLKYLFISFPLLYSFFPVIIMISGAFEAIKGLSQLYGFTPSNHALFRLTGSFFNPGPFSGYLAVILPISLGFILRLRKQPANSCRMVYYLAWVTFLLILLVLPAGMSRSAWMAALFSCGWVYWCYRIGWEKTKKGYIKYKKQCMVAAAILLGILCLSGYGMYGIKKDSARGRFLMWKITALSIQQHPFKGTGLGGFPQAYAQTQAEYFTLGKGSDVEKKVAGCPEYAFNEYLQFGLEEGVFGLITFIVWIGYCFYRGIQKKRYAISGSILSLSIFAFSSYPLQLPSFWVLLLFLTAGASVHPFQKKAHMYPLFLFIGVSLVCFWMQKKYYNGYKAWEKGQLLYNNRIYETAQREYMQLYPLLNHKPEFLFEGAQCLSKTGRKQEAIRWFKRAIRLSADPMIYYVMARNEQTLGKYKEAEQHLLYAIDLLPERHYPYFLLAKLYAEPAFFQPKKRDSVAKIVLTKIPKVKTTAIEEMKQEIQKLINKENESSN